MKYFLTPLFILFLKANAFSQGAAVGLDKQNVLYIGVENPVSFSVEGVKCKDVQVTVDGQIIKHTSCYILVKPLNVGVLNIGLKNNKTNKTINFAYRVKHLPPPRFYLSVNNIYEGLKNQILYADGIKGEYNNIEYDLDNVTIDSFTVEIINKKLNKVSTHTIIGEKWSKAVKAALQVLEKGDLVIIDNVHIKSKLRSYIADPLIYRIE